MKRLLFTSMGIAALLLGSCSNEDFPGNGDSPKPIPDNTLRLEVEVEGLGLQLAKTRADLTATPDEGKITSLFLLFFESADDRSGLFADYVEIENPTGTFSWHDIDMSGTQLQVTDPYHILAIANIKGVSGKEYLNGMDISAWMLQWAGKTEKEVITQAQAWTHSGMKIAPDGLLMSGRVEKARNQFEVTIPLVRNQVRFDVLANELREDYQLVSVEIRNAYPSSRIWNDGTDEGALDYSDNVGRIPYYYGLDRTELESTFDANNNSLTDKDEEENAQGKLYVFENQVTMPAQNDKFSTCLIIGLKKYSDSSIAYYRVNVVPAEGAQMLKRNNAYRLTINSVGGTGDASADAAYNNPNSTELDYVINYWDQTGSGVMVQDGSSLLSAPYKTVTLPRADIQVVNGTPTDHIVQTSFQIFTFTNKPNSEPLTMRQSYSISNSTSEYTGINAALVGNTLTITANPILSGLTVKGTITLSYMGLRATINVIQTDLTQDFLEVHLPDGGVPRFAPFGGIQSGLLRVEASDDWTAELFMPDGGFSFSGTGGQPVLDPALGIGVSSIIDGNKFRIWTYDANPGSAPREAFILVTLNKDPENYAQVIRVAQDAAAEIAIVPSQTVTFNSMGTGLASIPNNTVSTFVVRPGEVFSHTDPVLGDVNRFSAWDHYFEGGDDGMFEVDLDPLKTNSTSDVTDPDGNYITVRPKGMNTSGRTYNTKLVVYLTEAGKNSVKASINVAQLSAGIEFSPNTVPAVAKTGGRSQAITVQAEQSLKWTAAITTGGSAGGRSLVQHKAKLLTVTNVGGNDVIADYDTNYNGGSGYPMSTRFMVEFPKVYYPNREIPVKATVTVTVEGMTQSMDFFQTQLTPAPMVGYGMSGTPDYGGMGDTYNRGWDGTGASHGGVGLAQIPGYRRLGVGNMNVASINATVNYLHTAPQISGTANQNSYNWTVINNFIETRDAWTVISSQDNNARIPLNKSNSPLKKNVQYPDVYYSRNAYDARVDRRHEDKKIFQFLFAHGHTELSPVITGDGFHTDGVNTDIDFGSAPWPESGVVLLTKGRSESDPTNTNYVMMFIDIEHKFLWMGESQMFWYDYHLRGNRGVFLDNLMYFIANASKYGSHFTDLLLEDGTDLGDGRKAQPALWDAAYWGRDVTKEMTK